MPPRMLRVMALRSESAVSVIPVTVWEGEVSIGRSVGSRCERALVRKDVMDEEAWFRGSSQAGQLPMEGRERVREAGYELGCGGGWKRAEGRRELPLGGHPYAR
jgi:hypothetical protein